MSKTPNHPPASMEALGQSEAFLKFQDRLSRVAPVNRPVLIIGERGTGKELAATRLHYLSNRWQKPLIALNCAALTPSLIESELFGYEAGAFTGAGKRRIGRFEAAHGGTLFLDELGSIPMEVQEKILRGVEYNVFERVGGSVPVEVDVRIVGATHANLVRLADEGRFKRDLLDRLSFEVLFLPPLRERKEDILFLANHFARRMAVELKREDIPVFSQEAVQALEAHAWPGNVRELKNVIERAVYRSRSSRLKTLEIDPFQSVYSPDESSQPADHKPKPLSSAQNDYARLPLKTAVQTLELDMLRQALENARYNQKKAARALGLTYDQFRGLRKKYADKL